MTGRILLLGLVGWLSVPSVGRAGQSPSTEWTRVEVPGHGSLLLHVPDGWRMDDERSRGPQVRFSPTSQGEFSVHLMVFTDPTPFDPERSKKTARAILKSLGKTDADRHAPFHDLKSEKVRGFYYTFVRKEPADAWRFETNGTARLDELSLPFTVFTNDANEPAIAAAVHMLETAEREEAWPDERADVQEFRRNLQAQPAEPPSTGNNWKRIKLPDHGAVLFQVPNEWALSATRDVRDDPNINSDMLKIEMTPSAATARPFKATIDVVYGRTPYLEKHFDLAATYRAAESNRTLFAPRAKCPVLKFEEGLVKGHYLAGCDRAPTTADYRYFSGGSALFDDLWLNFNVWSNDAGQSQAAAVLEMLKTARREPATGADPSVQPVPRPE